MLSTMTNYFLSICNYVFDFIWIYAMPNENNSFLIQATLVTTPLTKPLIQLCHL